MPSFYTSKFDNPFQLYIDVSASAVGACLFQLDKNGKEHPIAFDNKLITPCHSIADGLPYREWLTVL